MALVLRRKATTEFYGDWPTLKRDVMIRSRVHTILSEDMLQHLQGFVAGRSFLIAGHRGAGKTMLVQSVVDEIRRTILRDAAAGRDRAYVRPLLVKLHGPSLLGDKQPAAATTVAEAPVESGVEPGGNAASPDETGTAEAGETGGAARADRAAPSPEDTAGAALSQIMVALYRSLAAEISQAVSLAARQTARGQIDRAWSDLDEVAPRVQLALDSGGDPGTLRDCWSRLDQLRSETSPQPPPSLTLHVAEDRWTPRRRQDQGCLQTGVVWPWACSQTWQGRGYQEIVAVATAAQSFQVCIGKVESSETRSGSAAREDKLEIKASAGVRDISSKIFALAAGFGVGLGVRPDAGPVTATMAGLFAALATSWTLDWSTSRSTKAAISSSYSFLPDRSLQSLDRDLPLVIERIRAIGLAPIFVVDEIDKVDDPDEPISALIRRLKQLTADFGFFCFLTDRDYLDRLEALLKSDAYRKEHTYFAHRLLVAHRPEDYAAYLRAAIVGVASAPSSSPDSVPPEQIAALILGRVLLHGSKLNSIALVRALADVTGEGQTIVLDEAKLRSLEIYRLKAMLQLAIELAMRQPSILARTRNNERFVQVAADAFYMISLQWEDGRESVTVTLDTVKTHLAHKMGIEVADLGTRLSDSDLDVFAAAVRLIADAMCDFVRLRDMLTADPGFVPEDRPLLAVFEPTLQPALLRKTGDDTFVFQWDIHGILLAPAVVARAEAPDFVRGFLALCDDIGVSLDVLASVAILPATITDVATKAALSRLEAVEDYPERQGDLARSKVVYDTLVSLGPILKLVLSLVRHLREWTKCTGAVALQAIRRYTHMEDLVRRYGGDLRTEIEKNLGGLGTLPGLPDLEPDAHPAIERWRSQILGPTLPGLERLDEADAWRHWAPRVRAFLLDPDNPDTRIARSSLNDVIDAATGRLPGRLFQRDFSLLGTIQWSELVLEGARFETTPGWTIPAGLFALRFGRPFFDRLATGLRVPQMSRQDVEDAWRLATDLAERAPEIEGGLLDVVTSPEGEARVIGAGEDPVLRLRFAQAKYYVTALGWLQNLGAFRGITDDGHEDSPA